MMGKKPQLNWYRSTCNHGQKAWIRISRLEISPFPFGDMLNLLFFLLSEIRLANQPKKIKMACLILTSGWVFLIIFCTEYLITFVWYQPRNIIESLFAWDLRSSLGKRGWCMLCRRCTVPYCAPSEPFIRQSNGPDLIPFNSGIALLSTHIN